MNALSRVLTLVLFWTILGAFAQEERDMMVQDLRFKRGVSFKKGGKDWKTGVDGVGMVQLAYADMGKQLPDDILQLYAEKGIGISRLSKLKPGDLVFFKLRGNTPVTDVGIYVGDGKAAVVPSFGMKKLRFVDLRSDKVYSSGFVLGKDILSDPEKPKKKEKKADRKAKSRETLATAPKGKAAGSAIVDLAMTKLNTPYKYGGATWNGVDCSGFTMLIYQEAANINLPHSASMQYKLPGKRMANKKDLRPGDLVFFDISGKGKISHVGIYIGDDEFVHAPSSGKTIGTAKLSTNPYWKRTFRAGLRLNK